MQRMTRPRGFANGIVTTSEPILIDTGNIHTFVELRMQMEPRQRASGKPYRQEVIVRFFGDCRDRALHLRPGTRIAVKGDFDVEQTHAVDGKVYANLVILARDFDKLEETE